METQYKAYLRIRDYDGNLIDSIGLSHVDEDYVERVMMGMMINMDTDHYLIDDSEATKAREELKKLPCTWTPDDDGVWHTTCGDEFCLDSGTPEENSMKYCPFCGHELVSADPPSEVSGE